MLYKDTTAAETIKMLDELKKLILYEAQQELYKCDYERIDQLLEEQSSLERRLKRLGEE